MSCYPHHSDEMSSLVLQTKDELHAMIKISDPEAGDTQVEVFLGGINFHFYNANKTLKCYDFTLR